VELQGKFVKLSELNKAEETTSGLHQFEIKKARIDYLLKQLGLAYVAAFSIGTALMYSYFFRNEFSSGGVSASDTISLALLSFGFFASIFLATAMGTFLAYPWMYYAHCAWIRVRRLLPPGRRSGQLTEWPYQLEWQQGQGIMRLMALACNVVVLIIGANAHAYFWQMMMSIMALGFFPALSLFAKLRHSYCVYPRPKDVFSRWLQEQSSTKRQIILTLAIMASLILLQFGVVQDVAFTRLGLRKQDVSVRMQKEDFNFLTSSALHGGFAVNPCEPIRAEENVLRHVDVLWNKLGTQSLLQFPTKPLSDATATPNLRHEVLTSSISTIGGSWAAPICAEFSSDRLFLGSVKQRAAGAQELKNQLLKYVDANSSRIRIVAHGPEWQRVYRNAQAAKLEEFIGRLSGVGEVTHEDRGETVDKWQCDKLPAGQMGACKQANIRFEFYVEQL